MSDRFKTPTRVTFAIDDLVSSDAHALSCRFSASVRIADTDADRRIFAEVFGQDATSQIIISHFTDALRTAAGGLARQRTAEDLLTERRSELQQALLDAARTVAFACGLEILPPLATEVDSPTLQRQRLEAMQRARAEARAAGQVQHLQRASELLRQFEQMRQQSPALSIGRLLEQLAPADRGAMLDSLLLTSGDVGSRLLWAVAGTSLARIDGRATPPKVDLFAMTEESGPLRSVQPAQLDGKAVLLIGARSGVLVVDPGAPQHATVYRDESITSQLGFSRVVWRGDEIIACHGEAGIVTWTIGATSQPATRRAIAPVELPGPATSVLMTSPSLAGSSGNRSVRPGGPRNLHVLDVTRLIFSVGNEVHVLDGEHDQALAAESRSEVVALIPAGERFLVVHSDGLVASLDPRCLQVTERQHRGAGTCAAAIMPFFDSFRLLLAHESGPIECVGLDDSMVTQYLSPHRAPRIVTAASDLVAAVSSDRQRVILWNSWNGNSPTAELHLTAQTRHRIADIEFY